MKQKIGYVRMKIERRARWDCLWRPVDRLLQQVETIYWRIRGFTVIECFGDSHVKVMRRLNWMYPELSVRFRTISVMGATAYGIVNYNSTTSAREIYEKRLNSLPKNHHVLVMLGEIDAGFLIWLLAEKKNIDVNIMLNLAISHYVEFLSYMKSKNNIVYVCSAPLPTVGDGETEPAYLALRGSINVSQKERTAMTLKFNALVKNACDDMDIVFIDLDPLSIDEESGLLKKEFINLSGLDHHYEENTFAKNLKQGLIALGIVKERY